jgi:hypothetical protein
MQVENAISGDNLHHRHRSRADEKRQNRSSGGEKEERQ